MCICVYVYMCICVYVYMCPFNRGQNAWTILFDLTRAPSYINFTRWGFIHLAYSPVLPHNVCICTVLLALASWNSARYMKLIVMYREVKFYDLSKFENCPFRKKIDLLKPWKFTKKRFTTSSIKLKFGNLFGLFEPFLL